MDNPYESILATPPDTDTDPPMEGYNPPEMYECEFCGEAFLIDDFRTGAAYYGVELVNCPCGCDDYSLTNVSEERVWYCGQGCFYHDRGQGPSDSSRVQWRRWQAPCGTVHGSRQEAIDCCAP